MDSRKCLTRFPIASVLGVRTPITLSVTLALNGDRIDGHRINGAFHNWKIHRISARIKSFGATCNSSEARSASSRIANLSPRRSPTAEVELLESWACFGACGGYGVGLTLIVEVFLYGIILSQILEVVLHGLGRFGKLAKWTRWWGLSRVTHRIGSRLKGKGLGLHAPFPCCDSRSLILSAVEGISRDFWHFRCYSPLPG